MMVSEFSHQPPSSGTRKKHRLRNHMSTETGWFSRLNRTAHVENKNFSSKSTQSPWPTSSWHEPIDLAKTCAHTGQSYSMLMKWIQYWVTAAIHHSIFLILITLSRLEAREYGGKSWHVSCQSPRVAKQTLTAICWTNSLKPCHPQNSKTCFWSVFKTNLPIKCICPIKGKMMKYNILTQNKFSHSHSHPQLHFIFHHWCDMNE